MSRLLFVTPTLELDEWYDKYMKLDCLFMPFLNCKDLQGRDKIIDESRPHFIRTNPRLGLFACRLAILRDFLMSPMEYLLIGDYGDEYKFKSEELIKDHVPGTVTKFEFEYNNPKNPVNFLSSKYDVIIHKDSKPIRFRNTVATSLWDKESADKVLTLLSSNNVLDDDTYSIFYSEDMLLSFLINEVVDVTFSDKVIMKYNYCYDNYKPSFINCISKVNRIIDHIKWKHLDRNELDSLVLRTANNLYGTLIRRDLLPKLESANDVKENI